VPQSGYWAELMNTDAADYGGSGVGNFGGVSADDTPAHGRPQSVRIALPPLSTLIFRHEGALDAA
jgi:1,4-alpha-glucan branching enzyme